MATLDYVDIPPSATRLASSEPSPDIRPAPKILTNLPSPDTTPSVLSPLAPTPTNPTSPAKPGLNFPQLLLSSALPVPAGLSSPRSKGTEAPKLLSTKDPLSLPITTANFKKFVAKTGPVFWLQDHIEEIITWKLGWKYTTVWMAVYAFLCYFPRLVLVLPFVNLTGIILATDPSLKRPAPLNEVEDDLAHITTPPLQPSEGSVDWLANLQGIQNLMGLVGDTNDMILPLVPHLSHTSPYTPIIFTVTLTTLLFILPIINILPLRMTFLVAGLTPFALTHPFCQDTLLPALSVTLQPHSKHARARLVRFVDDDRLEDKHWRAEMREVELWENERWSAESSGEDGYRVNAGWSKGNLKLGERRSWTRGRDGWSAISEDGSGDVSSNLTFSLAPGWLFVETEDWRPDWEGTWVPSAGADDCGWVYTNDSWQDPRSVALEEWKANNGITRRRRWVRRIYFNPM